MEIEKNKIPQALQKNGFGFVKLIPRTKIPLEQNWQNKPYSYSDIQPWIYQGGNYGVLGGCNGLIIIDADTQEIDTIVNNNFPATLTVRTPKQGHHYYYFCEGIDKKIVLKKILETKMMTISVRLSLRVPRLSERVLFIRRQTRNISLSMTLRLLQ